MGTGGISRVGGEPAGSGASGTLVASRRPSGLGADRGVEDGVATSGREAGEGTSATAGYRCVAQALEARAFAGTAGGGALVRSGGGAALVLRKLGYGIVISLDTMIDSILGNT